MLRIAYRTGHFLCVAALISGVLSCSVREHKKAFQSSNTPELKPAVATVTTPVVALDELRFAYVSNGRVACELSESYASVFAEIERWPGFDNFAHDPWRADLTPKEEEYALARIAEHVGDPYTLFLPESYTFVEARLSTVTLLFTGLGTFGGIAGILDVPPGTGLPEDWSSLLVFQGTPPFQTKAMRPPVINAKEGSVQDAIIALSNVTGNKQFTGEQVERLSTGNAPDTLAIVVKDSDKNKELYFLTIDNGAWQLVPPESSMMNGTSHITFMNDANTGILFELDHADSHVSMTRSHLFALPDLNGDGIRELLVSSSSYEMLYTIRPSFGPSNEKGSEKGTMEFTEVRGIGFV